MTNLIHMYQNKTQSDFSFLFSDSFSSKIYLKFLQKHHEIVSVIQSYKKLLTRY